MKRKLFIYALITSPIFALYGIGPIYIFKIVELHKALILFIGLAIGVFIFWMINIFLVEKIPPHKKWLLYLLSFTLAFLSHIPKYFIGPKLPFYNLLDQYIIYPAIITIAINTIILIICNTIILGQKKKDIDIEIEQLRVKNLEAQKQVLMQQLNPHFLFNSLSVLKSLIDDSNGIAKDYTIKLSDFLRYSVTSQHTDLVCLDKELQFVKDYVELQKVRFEGSFDCEIQIPDEVLERKIPVFALQTLVENAFKHNYFTEKRPLHIRIEYESDRLKIWNNKGSVKLTERTTTGLINLNKRYQLIMGKSIEIAETEFDFSVTIYLTKA